MATDDPGAEFKLVGGRLCLDFINTVSGRLSNPGAGGQDYVDLIEKERLVGWSDLARWAIRTGATEESLGALEKAGRAVPGQATKVVHRARAMREALYRALTAHLNGWTPRSADLEALNHEIGRAREQERLVRSKGGFAWVLQPNGDPLDRLLWPVARSIAELLTADELDRVTKCPGDQCHWMFLDTSRNRSRRWCDMADCGNLAKVRRFRSQAS